MIIKTSMKPKTLPWTWRTVNGATTLYDSNLKPLWMGIDPATAGVLIAAHRRGGAWTHVQTGYLVEIVDPWNFVILTATTPRMARSLINAHEAV